MLQEVKSFLELDLKLELSLEKSKITDPRKSPALFLGTEISISNHVYSFKGSKGQRLRSPSQIRMLAPLHRVFLKMISVGFMDGHRMGSPRFLWKNLNKDNIILLYNSVLRGYLNYYSFANNYNHLAASLSHRLKTSCAKLLAAKYTLGNTTKVLNKYGTDLKGADRIGFFRPPLQLKP